MLERLSVPTTTFVNIQGLRAIAALLVVSIHVMWPLEPMRSHWILPYIDAIGPAGVDIFFVISGFIIATVALRGAQELETKGRMRIASEFAIKRIIRIYPIYWIVFIIASFAMNYVITFPEGMARTPWPLQALLLAQPNDRILAAWTLSYEMYFYAVVTVVLLVMPRRTFAGIMLWGMTVTFAIITSFPLHRSWAYSVPFWAIILEFPLGAIVAYLVSKHVNGFPIHILIIGVIAFIIGAEVNRVQGGWNIPPWFRLFSFGPASALILYGLIGLERRQLWTFPLFWQKLGDASYSIYLWHQLVFACLAYVSIKLGIINDHPRILLALIWIGVAVATGMLSFRYLETPILRGIGNLLLKKSTKRYNTEKTT